MSVSLKLMCFSVLVSIFLLLLNLLLSNTLKLSEAGLHPYECGFDPTQWSHATVSLHFFKIGLIFVLFDLELMFLILLLVKNSTWFIIWVLSFFTLTLAIEILLASFLWAC